jgi:hypothetical protein
MLAEPWQRVAWLHRRIKRRGAADEMLTWLEQIDPSAVSSHLPHYGKGISPRQYWYMSRARALYVLRRYRECWAVCERALISLESWDGDGEGWIRCRLANCKARLGQVDAAIGELRALMAMPLELRWYVPHSLSQWLAYRGELHESWVYSAYAALNWRPHETLLSHWRVFWQGAQVCEAVGKPSLAAAHVLLTVKVLLENRRYIEMEIWDRVEALPVDVFGLPPAQAQFERLREAWERTAAVDRQFRVDARE